MKGNYQSLTSLAQEIERQETVKADFVVAHKSLSMHHDDTLFIEDTGHVLTDYAHGQVASKLNIPKSYYDNMAQVEGLRSYNVNAWLLNTDDRKLIRTLDGKARAFLSDRFKPIDNIFVMSAFLPVLSEYKDLQVKASALTEKKMYLQLAFPSLQAEVVKGDIVQSGIIITNSEVGASAVDIKQVIWRLVCSNGMIGQSILRRHHIGKRLDFEDEQTYEMFKQDTIKAEIESFRLRMRDCLTHALTEAVFMDQVAKLRSATDDKIEKVTATVENVTKKFGIPEFYRDAMIENIHQEGNKNRYGLANSITALAHKIESPDSAYEMEKLGNKIIELSSSEWRNVVAA